MSILNDLFAPSDNPKSIGAKFRARRLKKFEKLFFKNFDPEKPLRILDVGGTDYFWKSSLIPNIPGVTITLLNLHLEKTTHLNIKAQVGDATAMPEFGDKKFDLVFSNSVIEHVYTFENQMKMANEIQRVGKCYFIQTPNKYFPVEAHYAIPFAQYLPNRMVFFFLTKTRLSRMTKWKEADAQQYLDEIRLLDIKEMKTLFPGAKILKEKTLGMVKSLTAHNLR
ncbi:hypothetical protein GCM10009119_21930 [Algoriphagus jejuensis]|uniref:Methyltransferase type 11 domain-containing protein n=1 Tax=Algoriphagus jejuensis TaxID=419934 RepID=A0ABP3YEL3_9BACT